MKLNKNRVFGVVPAFNPNVGLIKLIYGVLPDLDGIVVVNDGSLKNTGAIFHRLNNDFPSVTVLHHENNLGKGAALKTAFSHLIKNFNDDFFIVTFDADGQHQKSDIQLLVSKCKSAASKDEFFLGSRLFAGYVPIRSRVGNSIISIVNFVATGVFLRDTQSGLRAFSGDSARKFTSLASNGYEFEMEMLASLEKGVIQEVPISTVYEIGNPTSHFSPIIDSTKILFVLLRFTSGSVFCAALDILLFALATYIFNSIAFAFFVARLTSLLVYFFINKEYVFTDHKKNHFLIFPFLIHVTLWGFLTIHAIEWSIVWLGTSAIVAKLVFETLGFPLNFLIQRKLIFRKGKNDAV